MDFYTLYFTLYNCVEDAVELLCSGRPDDALVCLVDAQRETREMFDRQRAEDPDWKEPEIFTPEELEALREMLRDR